MTINISKVDLSNAEQVSALIRLLDEYATSVEGGGKPLTCEVQDRLRDQLKNAPTFVAFLAMDGDQAVGLINCVEGFSTFAARPLLNIHDVIVTASHRRRGVARLLFKAAEDEARLRGACKLTLEVLSGNSAALQAYRSFGFETYQLDPAFGQAMMMQRLLELA
ncbi:MAG: GNAT family N-acetyltransferase [Planctomycetota bacterium]